MARLPWLVLASAALAVHGCTYFEIRTAGGAPPLLCNTMEWSTPANASGWKAQIHPAGERISPRCGQPWTTSVSYLGMYNDDIPPFQGITGNGMNEHGLAVSGHAFRGGATFEPKHRVSWRVCEHMLGEFILSRYKTVASVRAALPSIAIDADVAGVPGSQWTFADAAGDSVVVDYMGGRLQIHNNTVGVLTNDPDFSWQLRNLNNYVGLSTRWPDPGITARPTEVGLVPAPIGHGFNLLGLPGDLSPPSRFVRAYYMREYALKGSPPITLEDSLVIATGLLNANHIVQGFNAPAAGEDGLDYTQFGIVKAPTMGLVFIRTYEDMAWRKIDLNNLDMSRPRMLLLARGVHVTDVSAEFVYN